MTKWNQGVDDKENWEWHDENVERGKEAERSSLHTRKSNNNGEGRWKGRKTAEQQWSKGDGSAFQQVLTELSSTDRPRLALPYPNSAVSK